MRRILIALLPLAALGCGASDQQLRSRAAFDLQCPQEQVNFVEIDNRTRGVEGCGRRATYVEDCQPRPFHPECSWIMNGPSPNTNAPAPQPPRQ